MNLKNKIDYFVFGTMVNFGFKEYFRPKFGYISYYKIFYFFLIPQKIFRINGKVNWPVHFTSKIDYPEKITKGILCDPADSPGVYINAKNGIVFGSQIGIGPGVKITSSNNEKTSIKNPIIFGNNIWIGANSTILSGVEIGNNVVIGAGSVVSNNIPSNSISAGNPCVVIKKKPKSKMNFSSIIFNKKIPKEYLDFLK